MVNICLEDALTCIKLRFATVAVMLVSAPILSPWSPIFTITFPLPQWAPAPAALLCCRAGLCVGAMAPAVHRVAPAPTLLLVRLSWEPGAVSGGGVADLGHAVPEERSNPCPRIRRLLARDGRYL